MAPAQPFRASPAASRWAMPQLYVAGDRLRTLNVYPKETCNDNYHDDDADDIKYTHCIPSLTRFWIYILPSTPISVVTAATK